jgi:hypothetical protein
MAVPSSLHVMKITFLPFQRRFFPLLTAIRSQTKANKNPSPFAFVPVYDRL